MKYGNNFKLLKCIQKLFEVLTKVLSLSMDRVQNVMHLKSFDLPQCLYWINSCLFWINSSISLRKSSDILVAFR